MHNKSTQGLANAIGFISYNMTNDFMFRYILQKNEKVLHGLICALLHLKPEDIKSITITNPINLSDNVTGKEFVLDIHIELNNDTYINLEMQLINKHNWPDRSLSYLCRNYDHLYQGQDYEEARTVYHIGFLDFTLFPDTPEFYATYKMQNIKNHRTYSDKFVLSVVDLNSIELATEDDEACGLVYWARLFKAKTWEELKMLAKENEFLQEAAESIYLANSEDIVRQQCRARQEAERHERTVQRDMQRLKDALAKSENQRYELQLDNDRLHANNTELVTHNVELATNNAELATNNAELATNNAELTANNTELKRNISALEEQLLQMQAALAKLQEQLKSDNH